MQAHWIWFCSSFRAISFSLYAMEVLPCPHVPSMA